jgi:hypothetical protein
MPDEVYVRVAVRRLCTSGHNIQANRGLLDDARTGSPCLVCSLVRSKILKPTPHQLKFQEIALLVMASLVARLIVESRHMRWRD